MQVRDFAIRFSRYLIENLNLNDVIKSVNLRDYLKNKRVPVDTKKLHGDFAKLKIIKILENNGFIRVDDKLGKKTTLFLDGTDIPSAKDVNYFCTERFIQGVNKPNGKPKKFDIIIFHKLIPKYLFEVNFYSTEGTKIGINESEYIDLLSTIKTNFKSLEFYWITDGNYWLTSSGRSRYLRLIEKFGFIYNINLFAKDIDRFKI